MIQDDNSRTRYKNRRMYEPPPKEDYSTNFKKLIAVIVISFVFISGEFVGGYISGSISVISDAFHLVTDLIGFVVSFVFIWFSRKKPTQIMTFGYHRMELMGALGNLFIIWGLAFFLIYEATLRIINKEFVKEPLAMLIVAAAGLPINIIMYFVLHSGGSHSHGLMSESCGEQFPLQEKGKSNKNQLCSQILCQDIQCLISNEYEDHCHKKQGENQQIHKHRNKVLVEGNKIIRKVSKDNIIGQIQQDNPKQQDKKQHDHSNCKGHGHNHQGQHKHQHQDQDHHESNQKGRETAGKKNEHVHQDGRKCNGNHQHNTQQAQGDESNENMKKDKHKKNKKKKNKVKNEHNNENVQQDSHNCINQPKGHNHQNHNHGHNHDHEHEHGAGCDHGHGHSHHHTHESMSMKAAVLHALSDVIQSIGLLISSLIIFFAGSDMGKEVLEWNDWHYLDPISTYIFSTIVIFSTVPIVKNCYQIIMESTPPHLSLKEIHDDIVQIEGVVDVHDLHIWDLRPGKTILIAHVFSRTGQERNVLKRLTDLSRKKRIYHSTFQVEQEEWKHHQQYILCDHDIH